MTTTPDFRHTPDFPVPAGVIEHDDWLTTCRSDVGTRSVVWSNHDTVNAFVAVEGLQYGDDGHVERGISVITKDQGYLSADDARGLAAKLIDAADALDALQ